MPDVLKKVVAPGREGDSLSIASPYDLPKEIWNLLETYLKGKYKVEFVRNRPEDKLTGPTIIWKMSRRPGSGRAREHNSQGPSYSHTLESEEDGKIIHVERQEHTITLDFHIIDPSGEEMDRLAWDFEQAVLGTLPMLQASFPGMAMSFDGQDEMDRRESAELEGIRLRYTAVFPVFFHDLRDTIKHINLTMRLGGRTRVDAEFTMPQLVRGKPTEILPINLERGQRLTEIFGIRLPGATSPTYDGSGVAPRVLFRDFDWTPHFEFDGSERNLIGIKWNLETGLIPLPGSKFTIDYEYSEAPIEDLAV